MHSKLSYLQVGSTGTIYFRLVIPKDLRHTFGQSYIRRSLKTTNVLVAHRRAAQIHYLLKRAFDKVRPMKKMLEASKYGPAIWSVADDDNDDTFKQTIVIGNLKITYPDGKTVECEKIETDPNSERDTEQLQMTYSALGLDGTPGAPQGFEQNSAKKIEARIVQNTQPAGLVSTYIEPFIADKRREERTEKYCGALRDAITSLIDIIGDIPANKINRDYVRMFVDGFRRLPSNRSRSPRYRNLTVKELLSMPIPEEDLVSKATFNNNLQKLSTFALWLKKEKILEGDNPFSDFFVDLGKARYQWNALTIDEIQKIFHPDTYKYDPDRPSHYWVPLITSHSGSRIEEICCMNKTDIIRTDDIWCYRLFEDADDKSSKNAGSERLVPIHKRIIELGFPKYVDSLPDGSKLFPNLNMTVNGYHSAVSNSFSRYLSRVGVKSDKKSLKSFRHTVITELFRLETAVEHIREIVGHSAEHDITASRYNKRFPLATLQRIINTIDWGTATTGLPIWK